MKHWYKSGQCINCNNLVTEQDIESGKGGASKSRRGTINYICFSCMKKEGLINEKLKSNY